ncbi:hypothetical protein [Frankia sp. Cr1]|uniref:hypothetical protein n=1 Tax=Frankia sp. Cr1 TaxID=3073931 RepID=UPI002AD4C01D|nr:hypothetical protein [Frankia sp. Cr1]
MNVAHLHRVVAPAGREAGSLLPQHVGEEIRGACSGRASARYDVPWMPRYYESGELMLDQLITRTSQLDEINQGYADMAAGRDIRGVILFD